MRKRDVQLGTPKRPQTASARELGKRLRKEMQGINRRPQPFGSAQDMAEFHNLYTAYMALMLTYSTGTSPVWGFNRPRVFDPDKLLDPGLSTVSGRKSAKKMEECLKPEFCTWRDKDGPDGYHTRLLWLTPMLRKQLMHYQRYLDRLLENAEGSQIKVGALKKLAARTFFFLWPEDNGCVVEEISPTALKIIYKSHNYEAPSNANRSFLKSEWLEHEGPPDVIELFLGHWERGEEGFTASSALHPADYRGWLQELLPKILEQLKFEVVLASDKPMSPWRVAALALGNSSQPNDRLNWDNEDLPGTLWEKVLEDSEKGVLRNPSTYNLWQKKTLCLVKKHLRSLYDAPTKLQVSQKALDKFYYRTLAEGVPPSMAGRRQRWVRDLLALGVEKEKWRLKLPRPPTVSYRDKNLLKADLGESLALFHQVEQALSRDLADGLPETAEERIGQILLSAVLYGGLLRPERIEAFTQALGRWPRQCEGWLWLDLWQTPIPEQPVLRARAQKDPGQYARWFADPTTQRLIEHFWHWAVLGAVESLRCGATHGVAFKKASRPRSPWRRKCPLAKTVRGIRGEDALNAYMSKLASGSSRPEVTLDALWPAAFARSLTCFPPFLAAYAAGRLHSTPLPDPALLRVLTGEPITLAHPAESAKAGPPAGRHGYSRRTNLKRLRQKLSGIPGKASAEMAAYKKKTGQKPGGKDKGAFEAALRKKTKEEIENFLKANPDSAMIQLLGEWAIHLLGIKPIVMNNLCLKDPLAFSTVESYLGIIGDHLLDFFHGCNPWMIEDADRQHRYRALLDNLAVQTKQNALSADHVKDVRKLLPHFDFFLHNQYRVPRCQFSLPEGDCKDDDESSRRRTRGLVNANVLTEADFNRTLEQLGWNSNYLSRLERIRLCCAILGRRLGLRSAEILGLRRMDVESLSHCDCLVRRHKGRRIKSVAANRRLPLDLLLPEAEYDFVQEWVRGREEEPGVKDSDYLFTRTELHRTMLAEQEIMAPVRQAIHKATGDHSANFHHLRHSFYSDLVLQLILRQDMAKETLLPPGLQDSVAVNPAYLNCFRSNLATGRGLLHGMTMAVGHADVPTGLESYFHHCDWLLAYFARHPIAAPWFSRQAWNTLLALSEDQRKDCQGSTEKFPHPELTDRFASSFAAEWQHPLLQGAAKIRCRATSNRRSQPSFDQILQSLRDKHGPGKGFSPPLDSLRDREFLEAMYEHVTSLDYRKGDREVSRIQVLAKSSREGIVRVHHISELRACLDFCSQLGIPSSRLMVVHHPRQPATDPPRQSGLSHWQKLFPRLAIKSGGAAETENKFGCLDVAVKVPEGSVSPLEWLPLLAMMFRRH